jgi:LacI family transcriptional regulator
MVYVGLVFDYSTGYCRGVLRGIKQFAEARPHWVLLPSVPELAAIGALARSNPNGFIGYVFKKGLVETIERLGKPWVNVCGVMPDPGIPWVGTDDVRIGQMAASHLLDRGIRHFGFIGHSRHAGSERREAGFRSAIERAGYTLNCYHEHGAQQFDSRVHRWALCPGFRSWVMSLPRPAGVSAFYDMWGLQLAEVCRDLGLRVPADVAIVGIGNDDLLCEMSRPSLSSVAVPAEQIGHEAAALLERLMAGSAPPEGPIMLPPLGVVTRQSSDVLAIGDLDVAAAVRFIRQRGHRPIRVGDVLREVPISRRALERKFRQVLNRGVSEEIRRVHVDRARALLAGTDLPMSALADHAGFSNATHLSVVFRQETGMTPTSYRRLFRARPRETRTLAGLP